VVVVGRLVFKAVGRAAVVLAAIVILLPLKTLVVVQVRNQLLKNLLVITLLRLAQVVRELHLQVKMEL
jgi:hypothetical protein